MSRKIIAPLATLTMLFAVSACNTVEGAGEDIESVGDEIDEEI